MYPRHWLLVFGGTLTSTGAANEIFQFTIRGLPAAGSSFGYGDEDAVLDAIQGPVATWFQAPSSHMRSDAHLTYLKLNEIAPSGLYAHPTSHVHDYTVNVQGGKQAQVPPIVTVALSWRTAKKRGPGANGRIYPPVALDGQSSLTIPPLIQTDLTTAGVDLLQRISNPSSGVFAIAPCVVSKVDGTATEITSVRVGSVVDVQQRRKDALLETYMEAPWPPH